ncbi:MAG: hypothetical protein H0U59_13525 [Gemmatimonadaceae bacterium]|nr:hypothetical protein [Gemmatimonadaceae bacterium]
MSSSQHDDSEIAGNGRKLLHGRRLGPLLYTWLGVIVIAGLLKTFESRMPAFHDVVVPLNWIVFAVGIAMTLRWLRWRAVSRRAGERRQTDRRDERD